MMFPINPVLEKDVFADIKRNKVTGILGQVSNGLSQFKTLF